MMRHLLTLCLVLCLPFSFSLAAAEGTDPVWNGFRGLDWGAGKAEIIAREGEDYSETASLDEATGLTGLLYTNGISVSKFEDAYLVYLLSDDRLFTAGYELDSEDLDADFDYLESALSSLYGPSSPETAEDFVQMLSVFEGGVPERVTGWLVDGTGIVLASFEFGSIDIVYIGLDDFPDLQFAVEEESLQTDGL